MGVHHHRKRIATREPEGGGLTAESLTDTATDHDELQHMEGDGPRGVNLGDIELEYDERYTALADSNNPYTGAEAREDSAEFADKPFNHSKTSRDTAQEWRSGVLIAAAGDAYQLAGADPLRKCIHIKNVAMLAVADAANVHVGNDSSVPVVPGPGAVVLLNGVADAASGVSYSGGEITMTHTGPVWVTLGYYGVALQSMRVTYVIERYSK